MSLQREKNREVVKTKEENEEEGEKKSLFVMHFEKLKFAVRKGVLE